MLPSDLRAAESQALEALKAALDQVKAALGL